MRVRSITLREIRLPLRERFAISSGFMDERRVLLVQLSDEDGFHAWGECVADDRPNYSPETVDTCWLAITHWLAPRLLDADAVEARGASALLERDIRGHPMARAALEMAVWGLEAERTETSLSRVIGGTRERVEVGVSLGLQPDPDALAAKALAAREAGYRKVKLKIAPPKDLPYVHAVRQALGEEAPLAVDANAAYTEDDFGHLAGLDEFGLIMIEQPLAAGDVRRHALLQSRLETPLCLDESITRLEDARDMAEMDAGRIINIKPGRVGGFSESIRIHDYALERGIPVWCGGMLETGIGRAYNVALASLPGFTLPGDLSPSRRYWARDIVTPEWTMDDEGRVAVPVDGAGLGVDVDLDRIDDLTVRLEHLRAN